MKQLTTLISALLFLTLGVSHAWSLPNCVRPWNAITWDNCVGTFTWANGDEYVGDWKDNKRNGQGTYTYADSTGGVYVGDWQNDKHHGQGTYADANGRKYVGEMKNGEMHGQGTYTYLDGSKDVGAREYGELNGYAITYYADGSINQEGIFQQDKFLYAQKKSKVDKHKEFCEEIGFTPKTLDFGNCVLKLMDKD